MSWPTVSPSPEKARRPRPSATTSWLISRSVPICASVSRMPPGTRHCGRCRSLYIWSRAASSRGIRQRTSRMLPAVHSGSIRSSSSRQSSNWTYGVIVAPASISRPLIRTPRSFSAVTRPGGGGGFSSSSATAWARTVRSPRHSASPRGSSSAAWPVDRSHRLPRRNVRHILASSGVQLPAAAHRPWPSWPPPSRFLSPPRSPTRHASARRRRPSEVGPARCPPGSGAPPGGDPDRPPGHAPGARGPHVCPGAHLPPRGAGGTSASVSWGGTARPAQTGLQVVTGPEAIAVVSGPPAGGRSSATCPS